MLVTENRYILERPSKKGKHGSDYNLLRSEFPLSTKDRTVWPDICK